VLATVDTPRVATLEPIGGTGDTLTGIVAALTFAGYPVSDAAIIATKTNRLAGHMADPTPATQVSKIIREIPRALEDVLIQGAEKPRLDALG